MYSGGFAFGKDEHQLNVKFRSDKDLTGNFANVKIINAEDVLIGEKQ